MALYELLNPIPLGFFVAAWIFDIIYMKSFVLMWTHAASWLIAIGLVVAIIPRLISLGQMWPGRRHLHGPAQRLHFWLNLVAIVLAIVNAFIHSRDAYAVVPAGVILSTLVVALMLLANVQLALRQRTA
ncbi:Membrane protein, putative [Cronobacter muytjensii 530]